MSDCTECEAAETAPCGNPEGFCPRRLACPQCTNTPEEQGDCRSPTCPRLRQAQVGIDHAELAERGQVFVGDAAELARKIKTGDEITFVGLDGRMTTGKLLPPTKAIFAAMHEELAWSDMRTALFDGRHLILQLDPAKEWSKYAEIKRWCGGVVGHWSSSEDTWIVSHDPSDLSDGTLTFFDSRWFTGWKHLPPVTFEDHPDSATLEPKPPPADED